MKPLIYNGKHILDPKWMDFDVDIEIHVNRFFNNSYPQYLIKNRPDNQFASFGNYKFNDKNIKIFLDSNEPKVCYMKEKEEDILKIKSYYDLILTTNENILNNAENSTLFLYGTTWLNKKNNDCTYLGSVEPEFKGFEIAKTNTISFLKTNKSKEQIKIVPGYKIREDIWNGRLHIPYPTIFYYSNVFENTSNYTYDGPLPKDDKMSLFNSKFSIIVENSQEKNYFSEKLIDCLLTKTIPIYCGCPNICDYFDCRGILQFNDAKDLFVKIQNTNMNLYYENAQNYITNNFEIAKNYALNYSKRIESTIKEYLKIKEQAHV